MSKKILIIAPSWVGDMVMSQTLFKRLKEQVGAEIQLDVLVNNWACDIVKRMPEVNKVLINPFVHGELALIKRIVFGWRLRKNNYDQCFVLANSFKSAIIPFAAGIKQRTGFIGEGRYGILNDYYKLDKLALLLMIDRFCALANHGNKVESISYPNLTVDLNKQTQLLAKLGLNLTKPVICLCPAAEYGPAKRWPSGHFAHLASQLQMAGFQVWLLGAAKDRKLCEEIESLATIQQDLYNLAAKTNLVDVIDLCACAKLVVSNDSGLMHVACATTVPVIAIYGSSSAGFTPPLSKDAHIVKFDLDCAPCFARTCRFGHYQCLTEITPIMIYQLVQKIVG